VRRGKKDAERRRGEDAEKRTSPRVPVSPRLRIFLLPALALGLATFLLYLPSLWSEFVYDAEAQILVGEYLHDRSHFADVLTFRVLAQDVLDGNRPVQLLSLMVDSLLWGKNPFGYHLTSNLLHVGNVVLFYFLLVRLCPRGAGSLASAFVAALLFAVHPLLVEPVAEVSSREDLLATWFLLVSVLLAHLWTNGKAGAWALAGCLGAAVLACGAKETGGAAPFLILFCGLLFRGETPLRRWLVPAAGALVLTGAFFAARFSLQPAESEIFLHKPQYLANSFPELLKIQSFIWAFSIRSLFLPFGLSADYVAPNVLALSKGAAWSILGGFLIFQGLAAWKSRVAAFGAAIFWLGLAPVSNFVPIYRPVADRYLYLPLIGLAMTLCGILIFTSRWRRVHGVLLAGLILAALGLASLTWRREAVFANSLNLWTDTFAKSPFSDTAANNLGYALLEKGDYTEALQIFDKTLRLTKGKKPNAWAGAAVVLEKLGRPADAEAALDRAIALEAIYADPAQMVKSLLVNAEQAEVLGEILRRKSARVPAGQEPTP
jgi:tetratricopeptide (TPR) repeat protein